MGPVRRVLDAPATEAVGVARPSDAVAEIEVSHAASAGDLVSLTRLRRGTDRPGVGRGEPDSDRVLERTAEVCDA